MRTDAATLLLSTTLLTVATAPCIEAQQTVAWDARVEASDLPRDFRTELVRVFEAPGSERYEGAATIEEGMEIDGDLAASGGPLAVDGAVLGTIAVVGGDVRIGDSGYVSGDVIVVGGAAVVSDDAFVGGTVVSHESERDEPRYARRDHPGWEADDEPWRDHHLGAEGGARLSLRAGPTYNRVEGLPVMFGPGIRTGGSHPLQLEALGIWRTGASESRGTERLGYRIRAEQYLDPRGRWTAGGSLYSIIEPIAAWQTSDLEASLAAAGFREAYRDHFERVGWSAFVAARPVRSLELRIEYRDAEHRSAAAGDPWSLFNGSDSWRPEPIAAEGTFRSVVGSVELDTRGPRGGDSLHRGARTDWFARLSVERGVGGELARPELVEPTTVGAPPSDPPALLFPTREFATGLTTAFIDLRQYSPVSRSSWLDLRVVAGGNVTSQPLPPQFQHALGGVGSLPGYPLLSADCGARTSLGAREGVTFAPRSGCDRFVLGQIQYRGGFDLDFGFGDWDEDDDRRHDHSGRGSGAGWTVFFDAARGWSYPATADGVRGSTGTLYDAGFGLTFDDIGIFFAVPLSEGVERDWRFIMRLGPRF